MRIALAGFQHETNTFVETPTTLREFEIADSWPRLLEGDEIVTETLGMNVPIAGAAAAAGADLDLVPVLWCAAEPGGKVADAAFDAICHRIVEGVTSARPDGLYLDLHGAMVTQSHFDGEAELLARLRAALGRELPIAVSLDLHANISPEMVELADVITICRTYPHLDMDDAGARAMQHLIGLINGRTYVAGFRQGSFLVPLHAQSTDMAPAKTLYEHVINSDAPDGYCEMALGFSAADVPNCGPSVLGYAATREDAEAKADGLAAKLTAAQATFDTTLYSPAEAIGRALASPGRTILADVQDNPGAGGSSDTTGLLRALVAVGAQKALLGLICDPQVARQAHQAGVGAKITCGVGGASDKAPFDGTFEVLSLSDCPIRYTGKMYGGGYASSGPSCLLRCQDGGADVQIVVTSQRIQCLDQALFRHFGAVPEEAKLICVKSTVHFRDDFHALADEILNVAAPGAFSCKLDDVQYKHLRKGVDVVI